MNLSIIWVSRSEIFVELHAAQLCKSVIERTLAVSFAQPNELGTSIGDTIDRAGSRLIDVSYDSGGDAAIPCAQQFSDPRERKRVIDAICAGFRQVNWIRSICD